VSFLYRPAHGMRRIRWNDLAGHQPVEQHADAGQMLLDRWCRPFAAQLLDIGGDMHRLYLAQLMDAATLTPAEERASSAAVGGACIRIADVDGEEFEEANSGRLPCPSNQRRQARIARSCRESQGVAAHQTLAGCSRSQRKASARPEVETKRINP